MEYQVSILHRDQYIILVTFRGIQYHPDSRIRRWLRNQSLYTKYYKFNSASLFSAILLSYLINRHYLATLVLPLQMFFVWVWAMTFGKRYIYCLINHVVLPISLPCVCAGYKVGDARFSGVRLNPPESGCAGRAGIRCPRPRAGDSAVPLYPGAHSMSPRLFCLRLKINYFPGCQPLSNFLWERDKLENEITGTSLSCPADKVGKHNSSSTC